MAEFGRRHVGGSVPEVGHRQRGPDAGVPPARSSAAATSTDFREPLGVSDIAADAVSIFFQRFGLMFVLSLAPAVISLVISIATPRGAPVASPAEVEWPVFIAGIGQFLASLLSNALIVLAAFDAKIGRPVRLGEYVRRALANLITIVVLSLAVILMIAVPLGLVFLVALASGSSTAVFVLFLPALLWFLYVWGAFSPFVPAVVVEGAGLGALARAWRLTAHYRWRVVGTLVVLFILAVVVEIIGALLGSLLVAIAGAWAGLMLSVAVNAVAGGMVAVGVAMNYARLRGIKEGLDVESLADVFS
jgi:hypothetical protein